MNREEVSVTRPSDSEGDASPRQGELAPAPQPGDVPAQRPPVRSSLEGAEDPHPFDGATAGMPRMPADSAASQTPEPPSDAYLPAPPVATIGDVFTGAVGASGGPGPKRGDRFPVEPRARQMNTLDFGTFVLSSRYATVNLVMILLASAAIVAAFAILAIYSHLTLGFTVGLTSAGTVAVTAIMRNRAAKRRDREPPRGTAGG